jgi:hypothetical protein
VRYRNRAQAAAPARRAELAEKARRRMAEEAAQAERWTIAEGPCPQDVWRASRVIASFDRDLYGCPRRHVRELGQGTYLQHASGPLGGWAFSVCVPRGAQ